MLSKIVVPINFSELSNYAIKVAIRIAEKAKAKIVFLYQIDLFDYDAYANTAAYLISEEGIALKQKTDNKLKQVFASYSVEHLSWECIHQFQHENKNLATQAAELDADLIVVSAHDANEWSELFGTSSNEKIARLAKCPVLTLHRKLADFEPKQMVFASAFNEDETTAFGKLFSFAHLLDLQIHLLRINSPQAFESTAESLAKMTEFANLWHIDRRQCNVYNAYSIEEGINDFCKEKDIDLIAMSIHTQSRITNFFSNNTSGDLLNHAALPVLTMHI